MLPPYATMCLGFSIYHGMDDFEFGINSPTTKKIHGRVTEGYITKTKFSVLQPPATFSIAPQVLDQVA